MSVTVLLVLDQLLQTGLDVWIARVQTLSLAVSVQGIADLVVAGFIQGTQVVPDLGDVWVQTDRPRVGIERITVLGDLVVKNTNRAPEGWVSGVAVDGLLEGLVGSVKVTTDHVDTAQIVP